MVNLYICSISVITGNNWPSKLKLQPNSTERLQVDATIMLRGKKKPMQGTLARNRRYMPMWQDGDTVEFILFRVHTISFLPNYRVKDYDYIVKWCTGVAYNWCASLDIVLILATG